MVIKKYIKHTLETAKKCYKEHNLELLESRYINTTVKNKTLCLTCNYSWEICLDKVRSGRACPRCAGNIKKTLEQVKQIYKEHNLKFPGNKYKNNTILYRAKCLKCNWIWKTCLRQVQQNQGCPKCAGNMKFSFNEIKKIYKKCNLKFLEDIYTNKFMF